MNAQLLLSWLGVTVASGSSNHGFLQIDLDAVADNVAAGSYKENTASVVARTNHHPGYHHNHHKHHDNSRGSSLKEDAQSLRETFSDIISNLQTPGKIGSNESKSVGFAGRDWLPIGIEIEFRQRDSNNEPVKQKPSQKHLKFVTRPLLEKALNQDLSQNGNSFLESALSDGIGELLHVQIRNDHHQKGYLYAPSIKAWQLSTDRDCIELASPSSLSETQTRFAISQTNNLQHDFVLTNDGHEHTHVTVDAHCLKRNEEQLVGLLLVWERFHDAIVQWGFNRSASEVWTKWSKPIALKNVQLLEYLQKRFADGPGTESLSDAFNRLSQAKAHHDGYHHYAVNVCHYLNVSCAKDRWRKNAVPKFGFLEFRSFAPVVGPRLQSSISLAMRLVQAGCSLPSNALKPLALLPGVKPAQHLDPLLTALDLSPEDFH